MESPTAQPAEEKTMIVTEQPLEPPKNSPMTQPSDEFIRVPKTSSFRTSLPTYTASYEDEVATTGYATIPNQFKPSHPKPSHPKPSSDEDYSIHRKDLNDAVTNPGPMWDEAELSASTSDEEARWEQSLVSRAMAGPIITSRVSQTVVAGRCEDGVRRSGTLGRVQRGVARARDESSQRGTERFARGIR